MDPDVLRAFGQIAAPAGLAIGAFLYVARDVIAKNIFPMLTKDRAYHLIVILALMAWTIALAGIASWTYVSTRSESNVVISIPQQAYPVFEPIHRRDTGVFERDAKPTP